MVRFDSHGSAFTVGSLPSRGWENEQSLNVKDVLGFWVAERIGVAEQRIRRAAGRFG
jgi:hypothetical protein